MMPAPGRAQKPQGASPAIDSAGMHHRVRRFGEPGRSLSMSSEAEDAGRYRLVPLIVSSALFMQNLDSTVLTTALPTIARDFGTDPLHLKLALTSYLMALAVFVPASGWIADRFGARPVFQAALGVFALGSAGCALSWDLASLVGARVVQGLGGAMMLPVARLLVLRSVPRGEMVAAFAMLSMPALVAPIMGPPVGGFLTSFLSWHWIFWINLPIGIAALLLTWWSTAESRDAHTSRFIDVPGVVTLVGGLFLLSASLVLADNVGAAGFALMLGGAFALLAIFVVIERRSKNPIVVLSIFRKRRFDGAVTANLIANFVFGGVVFFMALYLQVVEGYEPLMAGLLLLPATIPILIVNPLGNWLGQRFGPAWPTAVGMAFLAVAAILLLNLGGSYGQLIAPFILIGIGIGLQITPCAATAVENPGDAGEGVASGVFKAASMIGGSLGVAVGTAIFQSSARSDLQGLLPTPSPEIVDKILSALTGGISVDDIASLVPGDAGQLITDVFDSAVGVAMWPSIAVSLIGVVVAIVLLRGRPSAR